MANRVHDALGIAVQYVVANPSSYAYPESVRPVATRSGVEFEPFDPRSCGSYDWWPYGLKERLGYTEKTDEAVLRKRLVQRPATYLLGEDDVFPVALFDASCAAMAQGKTRLARGRAFAAYVNQRLGGHHIMTIVPVCGHDVRCMFTANVCVEGAFPESRITITQRT